MAFGSAQTKVSLSARTLLLQGVPRPSSVVSKVEQTLFFVVLCDSPLHALSLTSQDGRMEPSQLQSLWGALEDFVLSKP